MLLGRIPKHYPSVVCVGMPVRIAGVDAGGGGAVVFQLLGAGRHGGGLPSFEWLGDLGVQGAQVGQGIQVADEWHTIPGDRPVCENGMTDGSAVPGGLETCFHN